MPSGKFVEDEEEMMMEKVDFGGLVSREEEVKNLAYLSDSSDEEEGPLLRVGNVPREWYDDLDHLGYNIDGVPIQKSKKADEIDKFLNRHDKSSLYTIYDAENDKYVKLSKEELQTIRRIRKGQYPHANVDDEDEKFWTDHIRTIHPIGNVLNPAKNRFIPSKWENKKILKIIQALRNGWIKHPSAEEEKVNSDTNLYLMWKEDGSLNVEDGSDNKHKGPAFVPPTKMMLPGHAESYNPPEEYIPTAEEIDAWEQQDEEERDLDFVPKKLEAMRKLGAYDNFVQERFQRCLDLYLCTRKIKNKLNIDPESLIPKLPDPATLRPFPCRLAIEYIGHEGRVRSLSVSPCGEWLASAGEDCTVRIWEVETGRLFKTFQYAETVKRVYWNPVKGRPLLAVLVYDRIEIVPTETGNPEQNESVQILLRDLKKLIDQYAAEEGEERDEEEEEEESSKPKGKSAKWLVTDFKEMGGIGGVVLKKVVVDQGGLVTSMAWHCKGDYFSTTRSDSIKQSVVIHRLSHAQSQSPFSKNKGQVQATLFHPSKPQFFLATKTHVRMYDLSTQTFVKKVITPIKWISSIDIHPGSGDHLIIGGYDRRVCWFDLDLTSQPYKNLKYHTRGVRKVQFHRRYPLFASASDDGKVHIFHGRVYSDLMESPTVVPLKIIRAHQPLEDLGVLDCCFHPTQPWIFTAGADGFIKLFNQ